MKFGSSLFFENFSRKFKFHYNRTRIKGTLYEDQYPFLIISHLIILRVRNVSDKICTENQHTHFMFDNLALILVPFMRHCAKHCTAEQATNDSTAHARCMMDT